MAQAVSNIVFLAVTDSQAAVQARVLDAVAATIALLDLPGLAAVYKKRWPWGTDLEWPCCVVTDFGQRETALAEGSSGRDLYGHPAYVVFHLPDGHGETINVSGTEIDVGDLQRLWREKVMRAFASQRLPRETVPESLSNEIEPAEITAERPGGVEQVFSGLTIRAKCRHPRGFGA